MVGGVCGYSGYTLDLGWLYGGLVMVPFGACNIYVRSEMVT